MMIDEIYNKISKTEDCRLLTDEEIRSISIPSLKGYSFVIQVDTNISLKTGLKEIVLYLAFPSTLSVQLPKIFISSSSYEELKYLPHINGDLNICVFDESINHFFYESSLPSIAELMIHKAKQVISQAGYDNNPQLEFEKEFKAYWEINYTKDDNILQNGLFLVGDASLPLRGLVFKSSFQHYKYLIYNDNELFHKFKDFLTFNNVKFSEIDVVEINYNIKSPPFNLSFNDSLSLLSIDEKKRLRNIINKNGFDSILVVFRNNLQKEYYGWIYNKFIPAVNILRGRQKKSNWELLTDSFFKKSLVERLTFSDLSPSRLQKRTSGDLIEHTKSVTIVGLGSIGSNLLNYLSKLPINKFCLVDPDLLKLENIYRHQFGINNVNNFKVDVAKGHLLSKNPFYDIEVIKKSVVDVLKVNNSFFSNSDFNFIVIGITLVEKYVLEHLITVGCDKPIIIIWIEPFLASGQMLYINSDNYFNAISYIEKFPFKVLEDSETSSLLYKEGSCQTGYYPYSETYITLFLSSIFMNIYDIIVKDKLDSSMVYTWIGDIEFIKSKGIQVTEFGNKYRSFQLITNHL